MTARIFLAVLAFLLAACGPVGGLGGVAPAGTPTAGVAEFVAEPPTVEPVAPEPPAAEGVPSSPPSAVRLPFGKFPDPSPNDFIVTLKLVLVEPPASILCRVTTASSAGEPVAVLSLGTAMELMDDRKVEGTPLYTRLVKEIQSAILLAADTSERIANLRVVVAVDPTEWEDSRNAVLKVVPWGFVTMAVDSVIELSKPLYQSGQRSSSIPINMRGFPKPRE